MKDLSPERKAIISKMQPGQSYSPTEIAEMLGLDHNSVGKMMQKLMRSGHLEQHKYGRYSIKPS
mgnify:CR=1